LELGCKNIKIQQRYGDAEMGKETKFHGGISLTYEYEEYDVSGDVFPINLKSNS